MRIHLPLHASQFASPAVASSSSSSNSPLITLGGDLVLIELQGELSYEGDELADGVIGVIGLDRPDKPTLHLGAHHLLHGKFVNLQKPYAVIRRVVAGANSNIDGAAAGTGVALEGDAEEEEEEEEGKEEEEEEEEEEDGKLFEDNPDADLLPTTPRKRRRVDGNDRGRNDIDTPDSSPMSSIATPRTPLDYSSELDMSSPARYPEDGSDTDDDDEDGDGDGGDVENGRESKRSRLDQSGTGINSKSNSRMKKQKKTSTTAKQKQAEERRSVEESRARTRHYEVVGVVRKKVVFALRPEPLVAPTILPA